MFGESKSEYVSRKVNAWKKKEQRTHEMEGTPLDADEFEQDALEVKHDAEDWYDFWHGEATWPW